MDHLRDRHILILEDEYLLASKLAWDFEQAGAKVVGPLPSRAEGMRTIDAGEPVDGAILDVRLSDGLVFAVAERLGELGIPFVFYTAYGDTPIPDKLRIAECFAKPQDWRTLSRALFEPPLFSVMH